MTFHPLPHFTRSFLKIPCIEIYSRAQTRHMYISLHCEALYMYLHYLIATDDIHVDD